MHKLILAGSMPFLLLAAAAPMAAAPAAAPRQEWKVAGFTWVKLVPREAGSPPNDHPAATRQGEPRRPAGGHPAPRPRR